MNLISCRNCAVVLDANMLVFPEIEYEGGIYTEHAMWSGDRFVPVVPCPVCGETIPQELRDA